MKGIILAGGRGTRLWPLTKGVSKQLLPIFDKPMIYYSLSTLMLAGIRDILIITTPQDVESYRRLLGDGSDWGVKFSFVVQPSPDGIAQAFILGETFIDNEKCALILGDNIFHGHRLSEMLVSAQQRTIGTTVFTSMTGDPERFGIVEFGDQSQPVSIEEKPENPRSNWALTGLYFCDNKVSEYARQVKPSGRGELEITDILRRYMKDEELFVERLGRGFTWIDCGTNESLVAASDYVASIERNQRLKIACPEEVAFNLGYIDAKQLADLARPMLRNDYGAYLMHIAEGRNAH